MPAATHWSQTYDNPGNPLIRLEQPVVWSILDAVAPGAALDAACGTGRHARRLAELGHHVIGVDASSAMVDKARAALPETAFHVGDLSALPLESASVDLVVCALALEHVADLGRAIAELSRVLSSAGTWSCPACIPQPPHSEGPHTSRTPLVVLASSRATVISTATTSTHFTSPSW